MPTEILEKELDRVLSDREVAAELGVPLSSLRFWWTTGRGPPSIKLGKHRRVLRSALYAWIRKQQS
jgi:predicted DNA-binding transcriptional regulator AlpA